MIDFSREFELDFSGVERFSEILSILEKNIEPSKEIWDSLFNVPGYRVLIENEFPKEFFENNFKLAFMPNKKALLIENLKRKDLSSQFLEHYLRVKNFKNNIPEMMKRLKFLISENKSQISSLLNEYIPSDIVQRYEPPKISFVIFGYDARGYSPIVVDLLFGYDIGEYLIYLLAHEIHHFYRNKILKAKIPSQENADFYLMWLLNQIEAEGIADLIDKPYLLKLQKNSKSKLLCEWKEKFSKNLRNANKIIKEFDGYLATLSESPPNKKEVTSNLIKSVPMSGHIIGYHMATTILREFGREKLISLLGDPFKFILCYNKVAESSNAYPLSAESINLIHSLSKKYA